MCRGEITVLFILLTLLVLAGFFFVCAQTADMESTWYNSTEQNFQLSVLPASALKPWCNLNAVLSWTVTK